MARYSVYQGTFPCHICKMDVFTLRFYADTKEVTWMCKEKHLSSVFLLTKKTKKDYEREERE